MSTLPELLLSEEQSQQVERASSEFDRDQFMPPW
jgi:hypothetical protein